MTEITKTPLYNYLKDLNSIDHYGVYVNCYDPLNDYIVTEFEVIDDKYFFIGNLESLSFGLQSYQDSIRYYLLYICGNELFYNNRRVLINSKGIYSAYCDDALDQEFKEFLENEAEYIRCEWSEEETLGRLSEVVDEAVEYRKQLEDRVLHTC